MAKNKDQVEKEQVNVRFFNDPDYGEMIEIKSEPTNTITKQVDESVIEAYQAEYEAFKK